MDESRLSLRKLRIIVGILLGFMTFQGWLGDTVNLFATFPKETVAPSLAGFMGAVAAAGPFLVIHLVNALFLLTLGIIIVVTVFRKRASRGTKIWSVLGLWFILSAIMGGILFVMSDYVNNAYSAQMGGSFIAAYAAYFLVLYYTKG